MKPLVSAVVPTYNYARFIGRAVESALTQTYSPMECIVVDDGSEDDTPQQLLRFGERIRVIRKAHKGVSSARNAALAVARGEFIAFLDGDDCWHPTKVDRQLELLARRPDVGFVGCGLEHVYPDGTVERITGRSNPYDRRQTLRLIASRRFWPGGSGSGVFVRRSVLDVAGRFDENLVAAEDWDMWLRIAAITDVDNVPDVLVSIHRHGTGVFRDSKLMETNQWKVYRKAITAWPDILTITDRRRMRALILADAAREAGAGSQALRRYLLSLKEWPFNYRRARAAAALTVRTIASSLGGPDRSGA
jgi:glycosyltransferase involved in cell wall biosynthesis